jgi:hypothetical protein
MTSTAVATATSILNPAYLGAQEHRGTTSKRTAAAGIGSYTTSTLEGSDDALANNTPVSAAATAASASPVASPTKSTPPSPSKTVREDLPAADPNSSLVTVQMRITRILQRFLVRSPHTFIAMAGVFITLNYGLGNESLAYSATTFVGVGGTVYCLTRALFLEIIPLWMLPQDDNTRKWRHLMNVTYTAFITVIFTSAVWKLPDLTAAQGLFYLTVSFGAPYMFVAKYYPDIDKQPTYLEQKNDVPR